jgi:hypothetical protein
MVGLFSSTAVMGPWSRTNDWYTNY